jgi:hypothetical protein
MRHDKVSQITAREAILVGPEGVFKLLISLSFFVGRNRKPSPHHSVWFRDC